MKAQAKPVIVDYFQIVEVGNNCDRPGAVPITGIFLRLNDGRIVVPTPEMRARMEPSVGDYWVIQEDGYTYLNPKDVFERKYGPIEPNAFELGAAARRAGIA